ncbi:hypothetical protein PGT21_002504 [Puccinia graminis f. sp. tritici]|uniref:Major facilitator superfamily (MFS) profile domain-containing protein n=1 Tax=Puccinia graminis f. sp. tritici TaxID=56615 RepID=A0A5B0N734_PUCGR|nr:hypothetical protein PGT21_002504 [Puccinia graminis f. sp. tritici]KAA1123376.1 hypothetical protein PGTUg99_017340 [Puccinia graminis f. sp. tritici]
MTSRPYILIELPSNLLVRKIGAGRLIPMIVATWGLVTCLQGLVTSYRGLLVARFFLGLVEGGLYPAIVLYLSTFYTRTELQFRIALFWGTICISGAASGLLTYAIIELHGRWGHPGWAWVFLIEGFVTVICGVIGFFILPSSIEKVKILTEAEKALLRSRLEAASSTGSNVFSSDISSQHYPTKSTMLQVWEACISPHVFFLNIAQFACAGNINSLAYFTPTIVNSFGYSPSTTQLFSVPPFAVAFLFVLGLSYWSDRRQARGLACGISSVIAITGFAVFYASGHDKVRYGSLFLSVPGAYGASPSLSAWTADNSAPHMRKATALALGTMVANSGGLFCVWIFTLGHKPRYSLPTAINLFLAGLIIVCAILNTIWLAHAQKRKVAKRNEILEKFGLEASEKFDTGKAEQHNYPSNQDLASAQAWDHLGDQHPDFKYIY